ncbi:hypothetical protein GCM10027451_09130 [Geodermatophilus aquaeductus]|uniref:Delta-60 repeat domain-containing protein n=1 Tax=Geodermatophilus aquaeductus TaxID=1564161 RepID=A0A521DJI5_9ACTN|nr:Calx-beta domain-containing protein [Geodermatophilus aquaeductus]SMO71889.1 delta-60 repeat domain-containing protein [Geodermatophilus aquaeductus]
MAHRERTPAGIALAAGLGIVLAGACTADPGGGPAPVPAAQAVRDLPAGVRSDRCPADPADLGELEFSTSALRVLEGAGERVAIVTRSGDGRGEATARVTTADGSATAGADYTEPRDGVRFADGDATVTLVRVPVVEDLVHEEDETLTVSLEDPVCATLGERSTLELTVVDDDPVATFEIAGTVSGLEGDGLVLRNGVSDDAIQVDGPFVLSRPLAAGDRYDVTVATQPSGPLQSCTVANGSGVMPAAAVTDVLVSCTTDAAIGFLDPDFGVAGIVTTPGLRGVLALAVQDDGSLLALGTSGLTRYRSDGELDLGFGLGGTVATGLSTGFLGDAGDVAVAPDGSVLVAGIVDHRGSTGEDFAVRRYDRDGVPDAGFGSGGVVTTDFAGGSDRAYAVAVGPDGSVVVAGHAAGPSGSDLALARYTPSGAPDPAFDGDGRVTTDFAGGADLGLALALQADGAPVVAGRVSDSRGFREDVGVVRYRVDGAPDPTFGEEGRATVRFAGSSTATAVTLDDQGRVLVAGHAQGGFSATRNDFALARLDAAGVPDVSFDGDGLVTTDFGGPPPASAHDEYARGVVVQPDGRIVAVGVAELDTGGDVAVSRYTADGALDPSFGVGGRLTVDVHGGFDQAADAAVQAADGLVLVGGSAVNGAAVENALLRLAP